MSFYDAEGNRLSTGGRRCACRIPKSHKASLKTMLTQEAETVLSQWPSLVKLADGAPNNSTYLSAAFPPEVELVDFYHACEYLMKAFDTDYGENSSKSKAQFDKYRYILPHGQARGEKIIRALAHRQPSRAKRSWPPTWLISPAIAAALTMPSPSEKPPDWLRCGEAACTTLATQRMQRSPAF